MVIIRKINQSQKWYITLFIITFMVAITDCWKPSEPTLYELDDSNHSLESNEKLLHLISIQADERREQVQTQMERTY